MPYIGYAFILLVCLGVILVASGKVRAKYYPYILYVIGAGMVLITSLAGPYLIGSDIHLEYYYAQLRAGGDVLEPTIGIPQGTSIITYVTDNLWFYKVIVPLLFAAIPVLLYFVFRKWITAKQAFLAAFFFIAFPPFFMELPGIVRQMTAEVVLAILLYLLVVSNLHLRYKIPLIVIGGVLLPLLHYAVGIIALILLCVGLLSRRKRRLVGIALGTIMLASLIYFPLAEDGAIATKLAYVYNSWVPAAMEIPAPDMPAPQFVIPGLTEYPSEPPPAGVSFLNRYGGLILSGLGFDFLQTTTMGKIFRILQWILLALIGIGFWKMRKNRSYWAFVGGGILLCMLLLIPGLSNLLNVTRFLHLALFLLAPLIAVALRPKYLLIVLIPYFLFTSGLVFEVTKQPDIERVTIPYSVGLSSHRLDLGASLTKDDMEVRQYIYDNKLFPIISDICGADSMGELTGWRNDLIGALRRAPIEIRGFHVFVRSQNIQDGTFTVWNGIGCKKYVDPEEYFGIDWNENIIYQKGDARVIWVE